MENEGKIWLGDTVLAINGAPLGWVTDHKVLAEKVKPLSRPVKVTFRREFREDEMSVASVGNGKSAVTFDEVAPGAGGSASEVTSATTGSVPVTVTTKAWSFEDTFEVFSKFDRDGSGDLDAFEISPALEELLGRHPSTRLIAELMDRYSGNHHGLNLDEFITMMSEFDWEDPKWHSHGELHAVTPSHT